VKLPGHTVLYDVHSMAAVEVDDKRIEQPGWVQSLHEHGLNCAEKPQFRFFHQTECLYLILEATHACNLACQYCFVRNYYPEQGGMMPMGTARGAVDLLTPKQSIAVGFFGGEPGGQRAVYEGAGFIHAISRDLWNGHPCCSVTAAESWIKQNPNTFMAFYRAIIAASLYVSNKSNRAGMAKVLSQPQYINAPEIVVDQVISGRYADGLGNIKTAEDRVDYQPFPQYSAAVWLMVQLRRWNMLKEDIDYKKLAQEVMLATEAGKIMRDLGANPPPADFRKEIILGQEFDSSKPEEYLKSVRKPT